MILHVELQLVHRAQRQQKALSRDVPGNTVGRQSSRLSGLSAIGSPTSDK
jgi:hypothetical protein